jgi:hypothetical protein
LPEREKGQSRDTRWKHHVGGGGEPSGEKHAPETPPHEEPRQESRQADPPPREEQEEATGPSMEVIPFVYGDLPFRAIKDAGEPEFIVRDICNILGLGNSSMAVAGLDSDETNIRIIDVGGGTVRKTLTVTFPGLCTMLIRSRKELARPQSIPKRIGSSADPIPSLTSASTSTSPTARGRRPVSVDAGFPKPHINIYVSWSWPLAARLARCP